MERPLVERPLVAITGARGNVGRRLWPSLAADYRLRLADRREFEPAKFDAPEYDLARHELLVGDLADPDVCACVCAGADAVVHLAADPRPHAPWEPLLHTNVVGVHNLFAAAVAARVRRVVFASSVNASLRPAPGEQLREGDAPEPTNLYGASKVMGEALASVFAHAPAPSGTAHGGTSFVCLRIGLYNENVPRGRNLREIWISPRDFNAVARRAIEVPVLGTPLPGGEPVRYLVVHATSNNGIPRLSLARARTILGYRPQDDAFAPEPRPEPLS